MFEGMSQRGIVSWNSMMMDYVEIKKCNEFNRIFWKEDTHSLMEFNDDGLCAK